MTNCRFMSVTPTLSQIRDWDVEHLISAADHWTATADRWESTFAEMHLQAHSVAWEGAGATAMRDRVTADRAYATSKADQLRQAASVARRGAGDISATQQRVMYVAEDAQNTKFHVGENLSVTDKLNVRSAAQRAARQAQAQAFAADIRSRVAELVALDTEVAANIAAAADGIGTTAFTTPGKRNDGSHIQLVDDHHHKCTDDQDDVENKIESAMIGGALIGGITASETGPGIFLGAVAGGAIGGIGAAIEEATTGGERYSGCE
jgi:hypothetical protein